MTEYVPMFQLRYPMTLLPSDITKPVEYSRPRSKDRKLTQSPKKLPRISKNDKSILTSKGQNIYAEKFKRDLIATNSRDNLNESNGLVQNSAANKNLNITSYSDKLAEKQHPKSHETSFIRKNSQDNHTYLEQIQSGQQSQLKNLINASFNQKDQEKRPMTPASQGKPPRIADTNIDHWLDLTSKREKIYNNMMKQHNKIRTQYMSQNPLGQTSESKIGVAKAEVETNFELSENLQTVSFPTPEEKLNQDVTEILDDIEFYVVNEKLTHSKLRPDLYLKEYEKFKSKRKGGSNRRPTIS